MKELHDYVDEVSCIASIRTAFIKACFDFGNLSNTLA